MIVRAGCALLIFVLGAGMAQPDSEELRKAGQALYGSLCQRCHGETGDSTGYPGITPLSGITLRLTGQEIASLSAPFVGRTFEGREAQALVAHLGTLRGVKRFERPGFLFSPSLLEKKLGETRHYRIIDARPEKEYLAGHLPNAVAWQGGDPRATTRRRMASFGAGPDTFVVVYDGDGGPQAPAVWWAIRSLGHERVAVLDGGLANWTNAGFPVSTSPVSFPSLPYPEAGGGAAANAPKVCGGFPEKTLVLEEVPAPQDLRFDWRKTRTAEGLRPAPEVREYLDAVGISTAVRYTLRGDPSDRAYLVFLLYLLGSSPDVTPDLATLCLQEANPAPRP